jgi:hypothetical protein
MVNHERIIETIRNMLNLDSKEDRHVHGAHLHRYQTPRGETRLQIEANGDVLASVVNWFGYDFHVIGLAKDHIVLLITEEAVAASRQRMAASAAARVTL